MALYRQAGRSGRKEASNATQRNAALRDPKVRSDDREPGGEAMGG